MITAILGSRTFNNYEYLCNALEGVQITSIISGGDKGVETLAEVYAHDRNIPIELIYANWWVHGKRALRLRHKKIMKIAEQVYIFWDGADIKSSDAITQAVAKSIPIYTYTDWSVVPDFSWGTDNNMIKRINKTSTKFIMK